MTAQAQFNPATRQVQTNMDAYARTRAETRARYIRLHERENTEDSSETSDEDESNTPPIDIVQPQEYVPLAIQQLATTMETCIPYPEESEVNIAPVSQFNSTQLREYQHEWIRTMDEIHAKIIHTPPNYRLRIEGHFPAYVFLVEDMET